MLDDTTEAIALSISNKLPALKRIQPGYLEQQYSTMPLIAIDIEGMMAIHEVISGIAC